MTSSIEAFTRAINDAAAAFNAFAEFAQRWRRQEEQRLISVLRQRLGQMESEVKS